jgi:hypothetical protein
MERTLLLRRIVWVSVLGIIASHSTEAASAHRPITSDQAEKLVWALPEAKAWAAHIERVSAGKNHGGTTVYDDQPDTIVGRQYWAVEYIEDTPDLIHLWQIFLVRVDGRTILVQDIATGEPLTLSVWRKKEHPMDRGR